MDNRGQMTGGRTELVVAAVVSIGAVALGVIGELSQFTGQSLAFTAAVAVWLVIVIGGASWLAFRGGRRLGDWVSNQWGESDG